MNDIKIYETGLKGNPIISLLCAMLALFAGFSAVAFYGACSPVLKSEMGLEPYHVGLLVAVPSLMGSVLRVPAGAWSDSEGGKTPIVSLLILSAVGIGSFAAILFFYPDGDIPLSFYPVLLVCGALAGCGIGVFTAGIAHVSYWFSEKRQGTALGVYAGMGGISSGIVTAVVPLALLYMSLGKIYLIWFCIVVAGVAVFLLADRNAYFFQLRKKGLPIAKAREAAYSAGQREFPNGDGWKSFLSAIGNSRCWALTLIYFSTFGGSLALTSWMPFFWTKHYGMDLTTAGIITGLSSALSPAVRIIGGAAADRVGGEKVSLCALGGCLAGSLVLSFGTTVEASIIGVFTLVAGIGLSNGSVFKLVPVYLHGTVGGAAGIIGGIGGIGGFVLPPVLGAIATIFGEKGYTKGFILYVVLYLLCLAVMFNLVTLSRSKPQN